MILNIFVVIIFTNLIFGIEVNLLVETPTSCQSYFTDTEIEVKLSLTVSEIETEKDPSVIDGELILKIYREDSLIWEYDIPPTPYATYDSINLGQLSISNSSTVHKNLPRDYKPGFYKIYAIFEMENQDGIKFLSPTTFFRILKKTEGNNVENLKKEMIRKESNKILEIQERGYLDIYIPQSLSTNLND